MGTVINKKTITTAEETDSEKKSGKKKQHPGKTFHTVISAVRETVIPSNVTWEAWPKTVKNSCAVLSVSLTVSVMMYLMDMLFTVGLSALLGG